MRNRPMPCPCGSGHTSYWQFDARGIELCRTCEQCHDGKMAGYRPEVLTDSDYWACEDIDADGDVAGSQGARVAVYQGVNTLCAHCGQPTHGAVDTGIFVYCSIACRDAR